MYTLFSILVSRLPASHPACVRLRRENQFATKISRRGDNIFQRQDAGSSSSSVATTARRKVTRRYATRSFRDISRQAVYSVGIYFIYRDEPCHTRSPRRVVYFDETRGLEIKIKRGGRGRRLTCDEERRNHPLSWDLRRLIRRDSVYHTPADSCLPQIVPFSFIHI